MAPKKKNQLSEVMVVNDVPGEECRIAILQDGHLEELYAERTATATNVGNIYKGRVNNVEPAIQAAFIDYGEEQNGFLHISDLHPRYFPGKERKERVGKKIPRRERPLIQEALKRGDEVLVQVLKEGIGTKGPTLTSYLSIAGRLLVAMPDMDRVGVSRKVEDEQKRREMREILDSLDLPDKFGFILRTAGFGQTKAELKRDSAYLMRLWKMMDKRIKTVKAPCELYAESDLLIRTVRDVLRPSIEAVIVDSESAYHRLSSFLRVVAPRSAPKVLHYREQSPIFHAFDVERQIELIHSREVPLQSGGALVIDQTEALVAIDVNSGRSRGARDSETNAYQTNCEAVDEICRQLRLRDLGGLIINDLIDMRSHKNRRAIEERFQLNLKRDRARSTVLRISDFGLVEMTRQRMRPSLRKTHFVPCSHCHGHGEIKSPESVGADAVRQIGYLLQFDRVKRVEIVCSPRVASVMLSAKRRELVRLEDDSAKRIDVRVSDAIAVDRVDFYAYDDRNADIDIAKLPVPKPPSIKQLEAMSADVEPDHTDEFGPVMDDHEADADDGSVGKKKRRRRRRRRKSDADEPQAEQPQQVEASSKAEPAAGPMRVHALAKELGVSSKELLERCKDMNDVKLKNHMSMIPSDIAQRLREAFASALAASATMQDQSTEGDSKPNEGDKPKRRRRRRGGKKHKARRERAQAAEIKTADEEAESIEALPSSDAASTQQSATANGEAPTEGKSKKKSRRRGRRKSEVKDPGIPGTVAAPAPPLDASTTKPAPVEESATDGASAKTKKKRKTRRKSAKSTDETSDARAKVSDRVDVDESSQSDSEAEPKHKPKRRRPLYRNRSRVSPTARQEAERVADV